MNASRDVIQSVIDSLPELAWSALGDGFIDVYNQRWFDYTGTTPEQMEGWGWTSVHDPALLPAVTARWKASIATGDAFEMEFPLRGADGTFRWFLTRIRPLRDETGRVIRWFGTNANIDAQRGAAEAQRFLASASQLLATSLDVGRTLEEVAALAVPRIADWCSVDLVEDDGSFSRAAIAHVDPTKVELARKLWRRYPPRPDDAHGMPRVVRTGESELIAEIPDTLLVAASPDADLLETLRALSLKSSMCVPLRARDRILGAVSFVTSHETRRYGARDLELAEELGRRAALAIDNARLFRAMEDAKNRAEFLAADVAEQCRAMDAALHEERARRVHAEERVRVLERGDATSREASSG
jgi:PAS domain S-box-containing protein